MNDKKSKGRPNIKVKWPQNQFTAEEVYRSLEGSLSRVSVHAKINKAVSKGQLACVGKIKPKTGRPRMLYEATTSPLVENNDKEQQ